MAAHTTAKGRRITGEARIKMAADLKKKFRNESFIGTHFIGRLVDETTVAGLPAVVPTITGRAWLTGTAQYFLDPDDPFPEGFQL
jgi:proline racemase